MKCYLGFFTLCLFLTALRADDLGVVKLTPDSTEQFVKVGDPVTIKCSVITTDGEGSLSWNKPHDNFLDQGDRKSLLAEGKVQLFSTLTFSSFKQEEVGTYECNFGGSSASIELKAATEEKIQANYTHSKDPDPVTLSCSMAGVESERIKKVEWLKNDTLVSELSDKNNYKEDVENHTLTILSPIRANADKYIARFTLKDIEAPYDCVVMFAAAPLVLDFDKSKNLIEDDNMELQCQVKGYPHAEVQWLKNGQLLNTTGNKRISLSSLYGYKNARLIINNVQFDDAGDYTCKAYSAYFNASDSKTLVVRVKDKLAALWPFLGIVGEVVILCTIIFIYEKRRNKQAETEANNAEDVDGSTTDKKEGLRHRNPQSNNPTA